jgi:hypothetical protein
LRIINKLLSKIVGDVHAVTQQAVAAKLDMESVRHDLWVFKNTHKKHKTTALQHAAILAILLKMGSLFEGSFL